MLSTIIAIAGTLLGAIVAGVIQRVNTARAHQESQAVQLRRDKLTAVTEFAAALDAHRAAMFKRGEAALAGAAEARVEELGARVQETRAGVSRPLVTLQVLISDPAVRGTADVLVEATLRLREAETAEELTAFRLGAARAHERFVAAAGAYFKTA
ncbi:hypothetical protein ACIO3O_37800 [Streptomyces sp. NPDC087440]|uniref:hypothetical protein n=1 Tax=Streptomyces sp. NPDC087440 TaxID=3365790 RepID=UPI00380248B7